MEPRHLHITVNLDALLGELQQALQFSINLVSIALGSDVVWKPDGLRLPTEPLMVTFDRRSRWTRDEASQNFQTWALSNGLRDAVEGTSSFIESAHQVLSVWELAERPNVGLQIRQSQLEASRAGTAFHRLGLPGKLIHIESEHGVTLDDALRRQVLSINRARNGLVHRRGIVSTIDADSQGKLTVEWRRLHPFLQDDDGEHELVLGQAVEKESSVCIKIIDDKKDFDIGDRIKFTAQEFADVSWGLFAFGSDLVHKISAIGQARGFVASNTSAKQRDQGGTPVSG